MQESSSAGHFAPHRYPTSIAPGSRHHNHSVYFPASATISNEPVAPLDGLVELRRCDANAFITVLPVHRADLRAAMAQSGPTAAVLGIREPQHVAGERMPVTVRIAGPEKDVVRIGVHFTMEAHSPPPA